MVEIQMVEIHVAADILAEGTSLMFLTGLSMVGLIT